MRPLSIGMIFLFFFRMQYFCVFTENDYVYEYEYKSEQAAYHTG